MVSSLRALISIGVAIVCLECTASAHAAGKTTVSSLGIALPHWRFPLRSLGKKFDADSMARVIGAGLTKCERTKQPCWETGKPARNDDPPTALDYVVRLWLDDNARIVRVELACEGTEGCTGMLEGFDDELTRRHDKPRDRTTQHTDFTERVRVWSGPRYRWISSIGIEPETGDASADFTLEIAPRH